MGLLHPDQCLTIVTQLAPLTPPQRTQVWERLLVRLGTDAQAGAVLPPARLENADRRADRVGRAQPRRARETLWILDGRPDDPPAHELRAQDLEPDIEPPHKTDTTWSWDLDDPYAWEPDLTG